MYRWVMGRCGIAGLVFLVSVAAQAVSPESPGDAGRRAFDDLAALYGPESRPPDVALALRKLDSADAAERRAAGDYLLALFRQAMADERNGRSQWKRLPFFGGGSESPAREYRKRAAEEFGKSTITVQEVLPAALWLVEEERLADNQAAGVAVLRRIKSDQIVAVYRKLLSPAHHNTTVAVGIVEAVSERKLGDLASQIQALCGDYRTAVRDAARKAATALKMPAPPEFHPEAAFTPWLEQELKDIAAMVLTPIPPEAAWKRFAVTRKPWREGDPPRVQEFSGWLLSQDETSYRILDLFAREETLLKTETKVSGRTMKEDADFYQKARKGGRDESMNALSESGGLTGQFQPSFVSLPEGLLSAWCYARGDKATAAAVLFPRLDEASDERWIRMVARDLLGWRYHDAMLHAFSFDRDYAAAARYARHLASPLFDEYQYHERAKELADQLPRRGEDFKTLTLPTAPQWDGLRKTLTRPQQVEYLAKRLRLLNCFQWGQPGGVSFEETQTDRPGRRSRLDADKDKPVEVINPYSELQAMKLEVKDLPPLIPYIGDDNFIPTFSYWRDFHPARRLYQVNELAASVVDEAAKQDLAGLEKYAGLDAQGKKLHLEKIAQWVAANAGKSRADLLMETLETATKFRAFAAAAAELAEMKERRAIPAIARRIKEFPGNGGDLAQICYHVSPADFLTQARMWVSSGDEKTRFWGAMILLAAGDHKRGEGLAEIRPILEKDDGNDYFSKAIDQLFSMPSDEATKLACTVLSKPRVKLSDFTTAPMIQRLILKGRQEALDVVLKELDSTAEAGKASGEYQGKQVERQQIAGDSAAEQLTRWRDDNYHYPSMAPDEQRAQERQKLKAWLTEQVRLIRDGKKSALRARPDELRTANWQIDAP